MTTALPDYVRDDIQRNVSFALEEDIRSGDITAQLIDCLLYTSDAADE